MNYLSLFSGIGGLDLGLDRAGQVAEHVGRLIIEHDRQAQAVTA